MKCYVCDGNSESGQYYANYYLCSRSCLDGLLQSLRDALLPFAAAAGRPGRLQDCMTGANLSDDVALGLGVKVLAWKRAVELTTAE